MSEEPIYRSRPGADALSPAAAENADDVLAYVEADVTRFRGSTEAFDDATMMAVRVG